jgi:regulator of sigma D
VREAREFNDDEGLELAAKVYPRITETTQVILDFNDKIDGRELSEPEMQALFTELSRVGEILASRFELEDLLIAHLHTANADKEEPA